MSTLYLHSVTLKDFGSKKQPKIAIRCDIAADDNELAATLPVNIFKDSQPSIFARLAKKFGCDTEDEIIALDEPFKLSGEVVDAKVSPHFIEINGERIKDSNGNDVIANTLKFIRVDTWLMTNESIIRSYERTWTKQGLIAEIEE